MEIQTIYILKHIDCQLSKHLDDDLTMKTGKIMENFSFVIHHWVMLSTKL